MPFKTSNRRRRLHLETLENRNLLAPLVDVGSQPDGGLADKIVYLHAGHGWTADNLGSGSWTTQRGEFFDMVEDLGNQDQMTFLADYLYRAGATVVPLRPVGHQPAEVVLDNDDTGVSFTGTWSSSSSSVYFGSIGDIPYRFASTSPVETAVARYQPQLPVAGHYPVYSWVTFGSNRASDQLYRINHTGGITEVTVNHQLVGNGPVYLGTYYFEAGTQGYVEISNRSDDSGNVVIADMIRFGNGVGDINRGGGVSGKDREDEAGLYWVQWHVEHARGISTTEYRTSSNDRTATVSLSPRYSEYMNNAAIGSLSDRVFVSFHSNGANGSARGVLGLYNGNNDASSATPNQFLLADLLASEVNSDLVAQNGSFEHNWAFRSTVTLDRSDIEFGEINNNYINNEFDATIIETGFHDNQLDAEMLRDPRVRDALARATYQGMVRYFRAVDGGTTPLVMLPGRVSQVRAQSVGPGSVRVSWEPSSVNSYAGDAPTQYRVYASLDGYGFDGGTVVAGSATSVVLNGLDTTAGTHYFRVVAENTGGQSAPSEVVAALPTGSQTRVLIVNGFDRIDRPLNPRQPYFGGLVDRVRPRQSNSLDYVVQAAEAIEHYDDGILVDSTSNEFVASNLVRLVDYDAVVWLLGEESSLDSTFDAVEQQQVNSYLLGGGKLFVSGSEIGWDLDFLNNGRLFYNDVLQADFVADDANTYSVVGSSGSIFAGINFSFDNGSQFYDVTFPDVLAPRGDAVSALSYNGGAGGTAGIVYEDGAGQTQLVNLGFPFETITSSVARDRVLAAVLDFFDVQDALPGDFDGDGVLDCSDINALTRAVAAGSYLADFDLNGDQSVNLADVAIWILTLKGTLFGDANLDSVVDGTDFNIWNANKFSGDTAWCGGDFNADGVTDGTDFNVWNSSKFQSAVQFRAVHDPAVSDTDSWKQRKERGERGDKHVGQVFNLPALPSFYRPNSLFHFGRLQI